MALAAVRPKAIISFFVLFNHCLLFLPPRVVCAWADPEVGAGGTDPPLEKSH